MARNSENTNEAFSFLTIDCLYKKKKSTLDCLLCTKLINEDNSVFSVCGFVNLETVNMKGIHQHGKDILMIAVNISRLKL